LDEGTNLQPVQAQAPACPQTQGQLPACAPLANPYVPYQQKNPTVYPVRRGMIRGTLFPGLDLPFMGLVNRTEKTTPLNELQALCFSLGELGLYLDTHPDDTQALELFNQYNTLYRDGVEAYEKTYGPLLQNNAAQDGSYTWLNNPWPWDYQKAGGEG